jgi:serine/threonine-protein kinase HipA
MAERSVIEVCADWEPLPGPMPLGTLYATPARGREVFSFEYAPSWLESGHAQEIDPSLRLLRGAQYLADERINFGVFLDSSPDRWGRVLMDRREAQLAREQGRAPRRLTEADHLLGVYDGHRLGGLRFRIAGGPFLDDNDKLASPPWTSLRELEQASLHLEQDGAEDDPAYGRWLLMLMAPGRSLGGARPKASVVDPTGHLWIAKFPSANDADDIGGWESVVHTLAERAGVATTTAMQKKLGSANHTFLSRRFDRSPERRRLHFASAMTLLERDDNEVASYLDLAELIARVGGHPARDLEQLWRRIVFFICVSNVDDHLRNHGFLLEPRGWSLAPAYDMNPIARGAGLTLNISETDNAQDLELARAVAAQFRVSAARTAAIIAEVRTAVRTWNDVAADAGLPRGQRERMAPAFRVADS